MPVCSRDHARLQPRLLTVDYRDLPPPPGHSYGPPPEQPVPVRVKLGNGARFLLLAIVAAVVVAILSNAHADGQKQVCEIARKHGSTQTC